MRKIFFTLMIVFAMSSVESIGQNPVTNLSAENDGNDVINVSWNYPDGYVPKERATLSWSEEPFDYLSMAHSIGDIAHRYESSDLENYIGWKVIKIAIYPFDFDHDYYIKTWKGTNYDDITELFVQKIENPIYKEWNTVDIDTSIFIQGGMDYWFGYFTDTENSYGLTWTVDHAPSVDGKGNLMKIYGLITMPQWETLSNYGIQGNFCIQTTIESPEGNTVELSGYKVYADDELIGSVNDPQTLQYVDDRFVKRDVEYCVTAAYGEEESTAECAVVEILSVSENMKNSNVKVFSNPADNMLAIKGVEVSRIMVYNKLGQLIETFYNTDELKVTSYPADLYLMKIISAEGKEYTVKFAVK